jgi:hypothetical protein
MVNTGIDTDPVEPGGKIRIVLSFEFIERMERLPISLTTSYSYSIQAFSCNQLEKIENSPLLPYYGRGG